MPRTVSEVTVTLGRIDYNARVGWSYVSGEQEVRYYPDGSGYPGSPPEFDCIDWVEVTEVEYRSHSVDDPFCEDGWGYRDRDDLGDCAAVADRWVFDELSDGSYFDDLRLGTEIE